MSKFLIIIYHMKWVLDFIVHWVGLPVSFGIALQTLGQPYDCPHTCQTTQSIWIRLTTIKPNRNTAKHKPDAHYNPLNIHDQTGQIITATQSPVTDKRLATSNNSFFKAATRVFVLMSSHRQLSISQQLVSMINAPTTGGFSCTKGQ